MTPGAHAPGVLSAALATHLATLGLVRYPPTSPGTALPAYVENMPDQPDNAVGVYTRPGPPPDSADPWSYPKGQLVVRTEAGPSRTGIEFIEQIVAALHGTRNVVWAPSTPDELFVTSCDANESGIVPLGPDQAGRPRWSITCNLEVMTTQPV